MKTISFLSYLTVLIAHSTCGIKLASPTGRFGIGSRAYTVDKITKNDPTAVYGGGKDILATVYYPIKQKGKHTIYFDPASEKIWGDAIGYSNGSLGTLETEIQPNAPYLKSWESPTLPTLVFSPGGGVNSYMYYGLLSQLVSDGFTILAVDHPGEPPALLLPNGTCVLGLSVYHKFTPEEAHRIYDYRVEDIAAAISDFPRFVRDTCAPFNTKSFISFGHSVGGAASAGIAAIDNSFLGGIDIDGALYSPLPDVTKPFLILTSINHTSGFDPSLTQFTDVQTAWWAILSIYDSGHLDFSDIGLWPAVLGERTAETPEIGRIGGFRMKEIVREYVGQFLKFVLHGEDTAFKTPSLKWKEVIYVDGSEI